MTMEPRFQALSSVPPEDRGSADLIQAGAALESMRDSGLDLAAAAGEPIDNSIEAGASLIRVITAYGDKRRSIDEIAFADNGCGIAPADVASVLSVGYSARCGQRVRLGRFGAGLKLAGLSLGRRIDVYTRQPGSDAVWHSCIDLDDVADEARPRIAPERVPSWPAAYEAAMRDPGGNPFLSGTLVVFGKIDRLAEGGSYGASLHDKNAELRRFIARAYRRFLDRGLIIELNGTSVTLHDPLFLMDNPRIIRRYKPEDVRGTVIDEGSIMVPKGGREHAVRVVVALAPWQFRSRKGSGGDKDHLGRAVDEFRIADSRHRISMLRNGREIGYDPASFLFPPGRSPEDSAADRYISIEIGFPAELDEFFQVRNVKRGAVPVGKLREKLKEWLARPVENARVQVRSRWAEESTGEAGKGRGHEDALRAAAAAEKMSPQGQACRGLARAGEQLVIGNLLEDLGIGPGTEEAAGIRASIRNSPFTVIDDAWPGTEMFQIIHLNGKAVLRLNHRHPFMRRMYGALAEAEGSAGPGTANLKDFARDARRGLDILLLAYAKAENMRDDPSVYQSLRRHWGQFTRDYLQELERD